MRPLLFLTLAASLALPVIAPAAAEATSAKKEDAVIQTIDQQIAKAAVDKSSPSWRTKLPKPTAVAFEPNHSYFALMQTSKGPIKIKLLPEHAPMHVTSFVYLTRLGFYDGLTFHRVIPGFMAQGGCPLGTGTAGPGYTYGSEIDIKVRHDTPGVLSMANAGEGTDGSQFFLTFVPTPWLNPKHTVYGRVVEGMETLKKLEAAGTDSGRPTEPLTIEKVTIQVE